MKYDKKKMCPRCPWRLSAVKGYLGDDSPIDFLRSTMAQVKMPCHCTVDYERSDWKQTLDTDKVSACAGALQALKAGFAIPRDPVHAKAVKEIEVEKCHLSPFSFVEYHTDGLV